MINKIAMNLHEYLGGTNALVRAFGKNKDKLKDLYMEVEERIEEVTDR